MRLARVVFLAALMLLTLAGPVAAAQADDPIPVRTDLADDGTLIQPIDDPYPPPPDDSPPPPEESTPPDVVEGDGLSGVSAEAESFVSGLPSCRSFTVKGRYGYIAVQTSPTGYVQWGTAMYRWLDNFGWWVADTYVNGVRRTHMSQNYPPHGSLPPSVAPPGSVFAVNMAHTFLAFSWSGIRVILVYGNLTCIVP
jgi:hypothetical protein